MDSNQFLPTFLGGLSGRVFMVVLLLTGSLPAQGPTRRFQGESITGIVFRYRGTKTVNENALKDLMSTKTGTKFRNTNLDQDMKALYQAGLVDDMQIFAVPKEDGVEVIADVVTRPLITGIEFSGNSLFSDQDLKKQITRNSAEDTKIQLVKWVSDNDILEARQRLEEIYHRSSYPDVMVTHRFQAAAQPGTARLAFIISEGSKNEIRKILFEGNIAFTEKELRARMKTKQKEGALPEHEAGRVIPQTLEADLDSLLTFYRNNGYLEAQIVSVQRTLIDAGMVDLVIQINEGRQYLVDWIGFGVTRAFKPDDLRPLLTLEKGDIYSSEKLSNDIKSIQRKYRTKGYPLVTVISVFTETGPNRLGINFEIAEGVFSSSE